MCSVWLTIPSARPPEEAEPVLKQWRERGYNVALWTDSFAPGLTPEYRIREIANVEIQDRPDMYPGYAQAVNTLIKHVVKSDPQAGWFICGGDDTLPDPNKSAEEIARECSEHFGGIDGQVIGVGGSMTERNPMYRTFGVMQCTGDRWHEGVGGFSNAPIDRVCGSPWMGREFCRRMYQGKGPLWPEFTHMFVDEHLQCVAQKLGVLWQRRDLTHKHMHWGRGATDGAIVTDPKIPEHLTKWNTPEHWRESKAIFERLKAGGFKEAENLL